MAIAACWVGWSAGPGGRLRLFGPTSDREIHDLGRLVHGLKNLGPHRTVTGFEGSESDSGGL